MYQRHRQTDGRTDRQTDRQRTCDRNTALCTIVHRTVKTALTVIHWWVYYVQMAADYVCQILWAWVYVFFNIAPRQSWGVCALYSVKIRIILGVRFERRKVDIPTQQLKHTNSILEYFEYFCQISSKLILIISSYTVSKFKRFLRHSVFVYLTLFNRR